MQSDAGLGRVLRRPGYRRHIGALDASASIDSAGFDPKFAAELQGYADRGAGLPADILAKAEEVYKQAEDYAAKAVAVGEDASTGAAIGAMVPFLGQIGVGPVVGAIVGAIYGVIDNFGDDIHDLFNPPDFKPDDYQRMQKAQVASGAIPVYGVPPDQYGACIYPDGARSGGDFPYPGSWNGEIRDQAAYDRAKARDAAAQFGITLGPNGMPMKARIPVATLQRSNVLAAITTRQKELATLGKAIADQRLRDRLTAGLARREAIGKAVVALSTNTRAQNAILNYNPNAPKAPATPANDSVRATAPPAPSSPAKTAAIVATGVGVSGLAAGGIWLLVRRYRR